MRNFSPSTVRTGQWLAGSGIQTPGGGVARHYRTDLERYHPISTEITGYAASAFAYLYAKTGTAEFAERALLAARFLVREGWDSEARTFPFEYGLANPAPAYFFDCGIIVRGLLAVWRMSGDEEFLNAAVEGGRSMARDFDAGADFHPVLELPSKRPAERDARWSRSSGCYQLKAAMAWRELADATADGQFDRAYRRMHRFALAKQTSFLPGAADEKLVMDRLHAYCYFLEAQVSYGEDVRAGLEKVAGYLEEIGPRFARSDVYAQLLRVRLMSGEDLESAPGEAEALETFRVKSQDSRIDGGFYFGVKDRQFLPYVNPVSTMFAMQALEMWREHRIGALKRDCRILI